MVWAQELQKGEDDELTLVGSAFQVKSEPANIDDLKEGIKEKKPNRMASCDADDLQMYYRTDGKWKVQEVDAPVRDDTSKLQTHALWLCCTIAMLHITRILRVMFHLQRAGTGVMQDTLAQTLAGVAG